MLKEYSSKFELDNYVSYVLHQHMGRNNEILRWDLVEKVFGDDAVRPEIQNNDNRWDRAVRDSVQRLRKGKKIHICNMGGGYFIATSRAEYDDWLGYYLSSVYEQLETKSILDPAADELWEPRPKPVSSLQPSLFGGMS